MVKKKKLLNFHHKFNQKNFDQLNFINHLLIQYKYHL